MEKQQLIRYAVLLIVGFALGAYLTFHTKELFIKPTIVEAPVIEKPAENKLFTFFDTFTADKDMGGPQIKITYPEAGLILLEYPNSQESSAYAMYDYKNNTLITDIGGEYPAIAESPEAFIGNNKLLVSTYRDDNTSSVTIQDFNGTVTKTLFTNVNVQEVYPKYGGIIHIRIGKDDKTAKTYILNAETFELTEQGPPKG